jgi:hypothetical protein
LPSLEKKLAVEAGHNGCVFFLDELFDGCNWPVIVRNKVGYLYTNLGYSYVAATLLPHIKNGSHIIFY